MNERELNQLLQSAANSSTVALPPTLEETIMARVRTDEGRARRQRLFIQWLLVAATVSGIITAVLIGWSRASRDTTHTTPPSMKLFHEGLPQ